MEYPTKDGILKYTKICEGQLVPHAHKDDALEYQYLDKDGETDIKANLCSRCVKFDRNRGYMMERTFSEENDYPNEETACME